MNWLNKITQSKPMAMPIPDPGEHIRNTGWEVIDNRMTLETADEEIDQYPDLSYLGSGSNGVVVDLGYNMVGKYTNEEHEVFQAERAKKHRPSCIVNIHEIRKVQGPPYSLWMIIMDRIRTLDTVEKKLYAFFSSFGSQNGPLTIERIRDGGFNLGRPVSANGQLTQFGEQVKHLLSLHKKFMKCLELNGFRADEAHEENVGFDKNSNLVLFDLGGS